MSKRRAYICTSKDHEKDGVTPRTFVEPGRPEGYVPECPLHGRRQMVRQANKPYNGKRTA